MKKVSTLATKQSRNISQHNAITLIDLGDGRTGIVAETSGLDSHSLDLVEYRDGVSLRDMRSLQSIGAGE